MSTFTLPTAPRYLVALSGGADSALLLELTVRALLERDPQAPVGERVVAAHLHHGMRGEEADRDEAFCRTLCATLGVPFHAEHADIPAAARQSGKSEETEAREARYAFLIRVMQERKIPLLLTAHHADDALETVLHHLLRGSGTRGMGGIPPTRRLNAALADGTPLTVARPLLSYTKAEILAACRERGLTFVTDSTNADADACTRNRLRHTVIPAMEAIAGEGVPQRAAARLAATAREDEEALSQIARARYAAAVGSVPPPHGLPLDALADEPPAIAKRMLLCAWHAHWRRNVPAERTLSAAHLDALLTLCRTRRRGAVSSLLPGDQRAEIVAGCLVFRSPAPTPLPPTPAPSPLPEGQTVWPPDPNTTPAFRLCVERADAPLSPLQGDSVWASAIFPADRLPLPLWVRARRSGDRILSHGMHKNLKKLLCDTHIPPSLRDTLPLLCIDAGETVLWAPAVAFRDGYPPPTSGACLRVTVFALPDDSSADFP